MENQIQTDIEPHSSLKHLMQSDRDFEKFEDIKKIEYILKEYIGLKNMVLKDYENKPEIYFQKKTSDGIYIFQADKMTKFAEPYFVIFKTLNKHIEIRFDIVEQKNNIIQCRPVWAKIAKHPRRFKRIANKDEIVYANNFIVTPSDIDIARITGFSGQMVLENEHKSLCKDARCRLVFFDKTPITPEISILKLHKMPIVIKDTGTMESMAVEGMKLFNLKNYYEEENILQEKTLGFKQKNVAAFIYYPIFFKNGKYLLPIGFFYFETQNPDEIAQILKIYQQIDTTFNFKIIQTNQKEIKTRQKIINISEGGFLLEITEEELIQSLKNKADFTVDITFKKQQPLKFQARICFISESSNAWQIGAEIIGSSDTKKNMDNLRSFLKLIPEN